MESTQKSFPKYGTVKSLGDTYFSQFCVRKKYIHGSEDPFLESLKLIKRIYNKETHKQKLISEEISIEIHNSKIKKPRILQDITNTNSPSITSVCWSSSSITYLSPLEGYCFSRSSAYQWVRIVPLF